MTCAKSLTGPVSVGSDCAARAGAASEQHQRERRRARVERSSRVASASTNAQRRSAAARYPAAAGRSGAAPSGAVSSASTAATRSRRHARPRARERRPARRGRGARRACSRATCVSSARSGARGPRDELREIVVRGRRPRASPGAGGSDGSRACTSHARRRSSASIADAGERIAAGDDDVPVEDRLVLERKGVERSPELVGRHDERRARGRSRCHVSTSARAARRDRRRAMRSANADARRRAVRDERDEPRRRRRAAGRPRAGRTRVRDRRRAGERSPCDHYSPDSLRSDP